LLWSWIGERQPCARLGLAAACLDLYGLAIGIHHRHHRPWRLLLYM
jgi:hypothetical protein